MRKVFLRVLAPACALLGLGACVNQAQFDADYKAGKYDYLKVTITENAQVTAGCKDLGHVSSDFSTYRAQAEESLRKNAFARGASVVFVKPEGVGRSYVQGEAYSCPATPEPSPTATP